MLISRVLQSDLMLLLARDNLRGPSEERRRAPRVLIDIRHLSGRGLLKMMMNPRPTRSSSTTWRSSRQPHRPRGQGLLHILDGINAERILVA
jgi:hypothetical protein